MASIALKDASTARGAPNYESGASWKPGRTVIVYVNGNYAGVRATGPYGAQPALGNFGGAPYGGTSDDVFMPSGNPTGAQPVAAQDATDGTTATATVTLT